MSVTNCKEIGKVVIHRQHFGITIWVVFEAQFRVLFLLLSEFRSLQEVIKRVLFLESLLFDIEGIDTSFSLEPAGHVFAEESLDVLLLSVAIHTAAWSVDGLTNVIQMRDV